MNLINFYESFRQFTPSLSFLFLAAFIKTVESLPVSEINKYIQVDKRRRIYSHETPIGLQYKLAPTRC